MEAPLQAIKKPNEVKTRENINQPIRKRQSNREKPQRERNKRTNRKQSEKQLAKFKTRIIPNK